MSELANALMFSLSDLSLRWIFTLCHFLWQGCLVGLVATILGSLLQNASASMRYGLYATALLSLPICVAMTFVFVKVPAELQSASRAAPLRLNDEALAASTTQATLSETPVFHVAESLRDSDQRLGKTLLRGKDLTSAPLIPVEASEATPSRYLLWLSRFAPWVFVTYAVGVVCFLLRLAAAMWGGQRLRVNSTLLTNSVLLDSVRAQAKRIGLRSVPVIGYCERVTVPTVIGALRPMILLPGSIMTGLSSDDFAAVLSHELAHIRRYDLWMNLLQRLIESLLFFHPVVWLLSRQVSKEREICCDDLVLLAGHSPMNYAGALLRMAELCVLAQQPQLASLSVSGRTAAELEQRIERLMNIKERSKLRLTRTGVMILLALLVTIAVTPAMLSALTQQTEVTENKPDDQKPNDLSMPGANEPKGNDPNSSNRVPMRDEQAITLQDGNQAESNDQKTSITATLPRTCEIRFEVVDAVKGVPINDYAILFKEDEATWYIGEEHDYDTHANWDVFRVVEKGIELFQASTPAIIKNAHVLVAAKGFEQVMIKLDENPEHGKPVAKRVSMTPTAPVEFTLATEVGIPASGAEIEVLKSKELRAAIQFNVGSQLDQFLKADAISDSRGKMHFARPAFSNWTTYRIEHSAGYVDVRGNDLPKAAVDGSAPSKTIRLLPYASFQGEYLPQIKENEFVELYRLQEDRKRVDGQARRLSVNADGRFEVTRLRAGWYTFIHRVRFANQGTTASAGYDIVHLGNGEVRKVSLGSDGRSVVGRLLLSSGEKPPSRNLSVSVTSGIWPGYPTAPRELDGRSAQEWWNSYWSSEMGKQFLDHRRRNFTTALAADGYFHFPSLPPGKYKLRLLEQLPAGTQKTLAETEFAILEVQATTPLDLGDLVEEVSVKLAAKPAESGGSHPIPSPVEHTEVAIAFNSGTALFDLDTSDKLGPMARGVPSDAPQFDLYTTWRGPNQTQLNGQVRKLLRVDDGQWETATAESIIAALKQQADAKPKEQQMLASPDNPTSTWIVQTKQGGVAILKVEFRKDIKTDTSGIVEGFTVRYKLATTAQEISEEVQADEEIKGARSLR